LKDKIFEAERKISGFKQILKEYNYQFYKLLASEYLYFSDFSFNTNMMIMITKMMTVIVMIHNYF